MVYRIMGEHSYNAGLSPRTEHFNKSHSCVYKHNYWGKMSNEMWVHGCVLLVLLLFPLNMVHEDRYCIYKHTATAIHD